MAVFFLLLSTYGCFGQNTLIISKNGSVRQVKINVGDELNYRAKGSKDLSTSKVVLITDNLIKFRNGYIRLDELTEIVLYKRQRRAVGAKIMIAGGALFIIDQFNNSVVANNPVSINGRVNRIALTVFGSGLALHFLAKKRIKLGKKWTVKALLLNDIKAID